MKPRAYIAIDLKSFYASVECVERGLDPLTTNLVVADKERTNKTICLAVTPSLKAYGIHGRPRLFEVVRKVAEINRERRRKAPHGQFAGESTDSAVLAASPQLSLGYLTATPHMALYIAYSARIYKIYLNYIAPEDIHVYSIDEVFLDATNYLRLYGQNAHDLTMTIVRNILAETGITATAGIGTNLYLAKVAMDIVAKKKPADKNGVRIAELDERSYRRELWEHEPLTDFWRIGNGYARRLAAYGIRTMGEIAFRSTVNEDFFYRLFGVNAELLIDHAWGWESSTIAEIKAYMPFSRSLSSGQTLHSAYTAVKARLVLHEMIDQLALDLVRKGLATNRLVLTVGYEALSLTCQDVPYQGEIVLDHYGRRIPKHAHGTRSLKAYTNSSRQLAEAALELYDSIIDERLLVRRIMVAACRVLAETEYRTTRKNRQCSLLSFSAEKARGKQRRQGKEKEKRRQLTLLSIQKKYGKNAILKGMNLEEGATAVARNGQIGGHKA